MTSGVTEETRLRVGSGDRDANPSSCLVIFSKIARAGRVKTRLIGELTAAQAADLHTAFLDDVIGEMLGRRFALRLAWALEPGESTPEYQVESLIQSGEDLGERLHAALAGLASEFPRVAAVGSDHPGLSASLVDKAFDKLEAGADVVLGPAGDGGYYLVGGHRQALQREIFKGIPWSSAAVLSTTVDRCRELDLNVELLPEVSDVDTPQDLQRLAAELKSRPEIYCPRTRALLRAWKRLS